LALNFRKLGEEAPERPQPRPWERPVWKQERPDGDRHSRALARHHARTLARQHSRQITDLRAASAAAETSAQIQIMTDEGDLVTISGRSEVEATYSSLRHRSRGPDGSMKLDARHKEISVDREFSLTVEGDLSKEELADIKRLLQRIGPALKGLASPDGTPFSFMVDGSDFESLAGFRLTLQRSVSLTHVHIRRSEETRARSLEARAPESPPKLSELFERAFQDRVSGLV
jgi:hypothetical protein